MTRLPDELNHLRADISSLERRGQERNAALAAALAERVDARAGELVSILEGQAHALEHTRRFLDSTREDFRSILLSIVAEDAENRRRLWSLRDSDVYQAPFVTAQPLVSITIPTRHRTALLTQRTLPSVLGQSYANLEVLVVGDHDVPETAEAVAALGDTRVSYRNLHHRVTASPDRHRSWLVGSTMPRNEASRAAQGLWLIAFDDDDVMHPDLVGDLVQAAQEHRAEVSYGRVRTVLKDGSSFEMGEFPPRREQFSWIGAAYHRGLGFFERELIAAAFDTPGDWFLLERMLRAGVRFGMVDQVVADYHPSHEREDRGGSSP